MTNKVGENKHSLSAGQQGETALEERIARIAIQGKSQGLPVDGVVQWNKSAQEKEGKKERKREKKAPSTIQKATGTDIHLVRTTFSKGSRIRVDASRSRHSTAAATRIQQPHSPRPPPSQTIVSMSVV